MRGGSTRSGSREPVPKKRRAGIAAGSPWAQRGRGGTPRPSACNLSHAPPWSTSRTQHLIPAWKTQLGRGSVRPASLASFCPHNLPARAVHSRRSSPVAPERDRSPSMKVALGRAPPNVRKKLHPYPAAVLETVLRRACSPRATESSWRCPPVQTRRRSSSPWRSSVMPAVSRPWDSTRSTSTTAFARTARRTRRMPPPSATGWESRSRPSGSRCASGNVQAEARRARYRALETAAARVGATRIATGHTRTDQAETVLLSLLRGAGARGLAGIPPRRGAIVRPLIDRLARRGISVPREVRGIPWRDGPHQRDASLRAEPRAARGLAGARRARPRGRARHRARGRSRPGGRACAREARARHRGRRGRACRSTRSDRRRSR